MRPEIGLPPDVSSEGWRIDALLHHTLIAVGVIALVATVWLLWALVSSRRDKTPRYSHGVSRGAIAIPLSIAAVIFFAVDARLFAISTSDLDVLTDVAAAEADPNAVRIEINAHQWAWDVRYAGIDGRFATADDVVVLDELRIPRGAPIIVQLAAVDVIHSFSIPGLRIKQDVVPGTLQTVWFEATATGQLEIACAQHCGVNHYKMRGVVTVMPPAAFSAWQEQASRDAERTRAVFRKAIADGAKARAVLDWGWAWQP